MWSSCGVYGSARRWNKVFLTGSVQSWFMHAQLWSMHMWRKEKATELRPKNGASNNCYFCGAQKLFSGRLGEHPRYNFTE